MRIEKIVQIKSVGRLLDAKCSGDVSFRQYNVVFGENGRGKTTLCAILRSLQSGDAAYITGGRTLGAPDVPEIHLRLDDGQAAFSAKFSSGAWNRTVPELVVFDEDFVRENVPSTAEVSTGSS